MSRPRGVVGARLTFALALVCWGVIGCGAPSGDTQVAAIVDKSEISVHQVEEALKHQTSLLALQPDAAAKVVLDGLIEQEIAAQAAIKAGMDHDPAVVQALQLARREVLARSVQDRVASQVTQPSSQDIEAFYAAHPGLFAARRVYTLQQFSVTVPADALPSLQQIAKLARNADEVADALRKANLPFGSRLVPKAPEDLEFPMVDALAAMGEGQSMAFPQPDGVLLLTVLRAQEAPLDRAVATPVITAYLLSQRRRDALEQYMKGLRVGAKVQYAGPFASEASAPGANPVAPPVSK